MNAGEGAGSDGDDAVHEPGAGAIPPLAHREAYLAHLAAERGLADNTLRAYARDLAVYARYLDAVGITDPATVTIEDLEAYLVWLREQRAGRSGRAYAASTLARLVVAVRGYHRFLLHDELASADPSAQLGTPRTARPLPKALSVAEVERLLTAPTGDGALVRRDRAMLELLYGAGLRISELVGLDVDDLDPVERLVSVRGKGDAQRLVPFGEPAAEAVDAWLVQGRPALHPQGPGVFLNARGGRLTRQGAWKLITAHAERVELGDRVSPHTLRHSFATHLLDGGADVRVVQELLGHASVTTTQIYTLVSRQALTEVYRRTHPRSGA